MHITEFIKVQNTSNEWDMGRSLDMVHSLGEIKGFGLE